MLTESKPIWRHGAEPKQLQRRVAAVGRRDDRVVELVPAGVCKDGWDLAQRHVLERVARVAERVFVVRVRYLAETLVAVVSFPDAKQGVQMPVLAESLRALLGSGRVRVARVLEQLHLVAHRHVVVEKFGHKLVRLQRHRADGLCAAMQELLCHRRLIRGLDLAVERVVRELERHLDVRVGRHAHFLDTLHSVRLELERSKLILVDEVAEPCFAKPQRQRQLRRQLPFELAGRRHHVAKRGRVSGCRVWRVRFPERRRVGVDRARKAQNRVRVDVRGKAQHGVAVHTRVLEVDADFGVLGDDKLQLVVPSVGAGPDLDAVLKTRLAAQEVFRHAREVVADLDVVQNDNEERRVEHAHDFSVVWVTDNFLAQTGPDAAVFCRQHAERRLGHVADARRLGVLDNALQIELDVCLGENQVVVAVHDVKPVELRPAEHDDVARLRVGLQNTACVRGHSAGAKQLWVLVHVENDAVLESIDAELVATKSTHKPQARGGQARGARQLRRPQRRRVVLQHNERVQVQHDGRVVVQVRVVPKLLDIRISGLGVLQQLVLEHGSGRLQEPAAVCDRLSVLVLRLEGLEHVEPGLSCAVASSELSSRACVPSRRSLLARTWVETRSDESSREYRLSESVAEQAEAEPAWCLRKYSSAMSGTQWLHDGAGIRGLSSLRLAEGEVAGEVFAVDADMTDESESEAVTMGAGKTACFSFLVSLPSGLYRHCRGDTSAQRRPGAPSQERLLARIGDEQERHSSLRSSEASVPTERDRLLKKSALKCWNSLRPDVLSMALMFIGVHKPNSLELIAVSTVRSSLSRSLSLTLPRGKLSIARSSHPRPTLEPPCSMLSFTSLTTSSFASGQQSLGKVKISPPSSLVSNSSPVATAKFSTLYFSASGMSSAIETGGVSNPHEYRSTKNCSTDEIVPYSGYVSSARTATRYTGSTRLLSSNFTGRNMSTSLPIRKKSSTSSVYSGMSSFPSSLKILMKFPACCTENPQTASLMSAETSSSAAYSLMNAPETHK
ncbi:hypothetical protein OGATHE_002850 [Ogataea polymorpha]|uniref:Uncharacterized protein n=1 Tax=Ogataea polymorpha TaxID=460523 RepID=A0A9P8PDK8_9ASCO|nr:hypothetical protein OGATHE_002850 [Ogataea polymorpha]